MFDDRQAAVRILREAGSVLVVTHENPDGDAIGGLLAMTHALRSLGVAATPYDVDRMPKYLTWVPGAEWLTNEADPAAFGAVCALDCGAASRMGPLTPQILQHASLVNIDHHATNDGFGRANVVVPRASSTCEILCGVLPELGAKFTPQIATLLYLGVYTDTTMFQNDATTAAALCAAGDLIAAGADFKTVAQRVYLDSSAPRLTLLGRVLSTLQVDAGGQIVGMVCEKKNLDELGLGPDEMETFVEHPRSVVGARAAYMLREVDGKGLVKGSLRAVGDVDVAKIAARFGGGGHTKAAGFRAQGTLAEVRARLIGYLKESLGAE